MDDFDSYAIQTSSEESNHFTRHHLVTPASPEDPRVARRNDGLELELVRGQQGGVLGSKQVSFQCY